MNSKRKKMIVSAIPLPSHEALDENRCLCGHEMNDCLSAHCEQPAMHYTLSEVDAMERKLEALRRLGTAEDMLEVPDKDDDSYLEGWQEGAFYVVRRMRAILDGKAADDAGRAE